MPPTARFESSAGAGGSKTKLSNVAAGDCFRITNVPAESRRLSQVMPAPAPLSVAAIVTVVGTSALTRMPSATLPESAGDQGICRESNLNANTSRRRDAYALSTVTLSPVTVSTPPALASRLSTLMLRTGVTLKESTSAAKVVVESMLSGRR
jgi:hypothetical protein